MTDHYYSHRPETESEPIYWSTTLRGSSFHFKTDRGVFSKGEVDFGSRHLLESFSMPDIDGPVLDVGCGYGPIGLSIAKDYPGRHVHMTDVNERALGLAKENAQQNGIENVAIYESSGFQSIQERNFAAILTNPPIRAGKQVVFDIFEGSFSHLAHGGELWVVIQKKQGAPSAKVKLEELFGKVNVVNKKKGYFILKAIKI
ncbi:class I SAM-dependent methyltransferase [Siminovitchia sp. 179-K 8D1 HS]|uniref:class I SAM-dependent methyltransferase n=1 Tax=Siminovitchia sp. 179-K 8D1 HS TaxID=3142385 RepID=UPI0039A068D6